MTRKMIKCREHDFKTKTIIENKPGGNDKLNAVELNVTLAFEKPWDLSINNFSGYEMLQAWARAYIHDSYEVNDEGIDIRAYEPWVPLHKVQLTYIGKGYAISTGTQAPKEYVSDQQDEDNYRDKCNEESKTPSNVGFKLYLMERIANCKGDYIKTEEQ